ncbi:hypothetical protein HMPREF3136_00585 [Neisseria sp. HMSC15C08]|jgi:hypothetical protein|nr:hypothetical protein HMPREF2844_05610 [Neisseria sp. HMSC072F04]OFV45480.1 hypothetical protein HMPREF3136_00585 [Neisseria sp. HMSC15C08]
MADAYIYFTIILVYVLIYFFLFKIIGKVIKLCKKDIYGTFFIILLSYNTIYLLYVVCYNQRKQTHFKISEINFALIFKPVEISGFSF